MPDYVVTGNPETMQVLADALNTDILTAKALIIDAVVAKNKAETEHKYII